jgi:predicted MFS family arabinose efflux permease
MPGMETATQWRLVLLIWAAGLGAAAQYGKISVIFDRLPEVYPDAGAALGFAVSLVGAVGIVLGVVAGVFVARIGYRRALLGGLLVGAAMSAVQAAWPPLPLFLVSRVAEGTAHLAIVVAAPTMIAEVTAPRDQGRALTLWGTFFGVAFAVLAFAGIPLADRLGLGALMLAHAAFLLVMAAVLWRPLPRLVETPRAVRVAEVLRAHARLYASPRIGAAALGWLFYTFCFVSSLTVLPLFIDEAWRALTIGVMPLLSILSSLTLGVWLLHRMPAWRVVVAGFAACALSAVALFLFPGHPAAALALGAALGLVQGASFAVVPELNAATQDRALANGGLAQMGNLGNTTGTPVMLSVIAVAGYGGLALVLVAAFLAGLALHLALAARR